MVRAITEIYNKNAKYKMIKRKRAKPWIYPTSEIEFEKCITDALQITNDINILNSTKVNIITQI